MGAITGCLEVASYRERFEEHRYICENGPRATVDGFVLYKCIDGCVREARVHGPGMAGDQYFIELSAGWGVEFVFWKGHAECDPVLGKRANWSSCCQDRQYELSWDCPQSPHDSLRNPRAWCIMHAEWCHIRKVDAALLTDSNTMLSRIVINKDITTGAMTEELRLDFQKLYWDIQPWSNPDSLVIEAFEKMVQGRFKHLPVIALLDFAKCLHAATSWTEKDAEHGSTTAAAVDRTERQWTYVIC